MLPGFYCFAGSYTPTGTCTYAPVLVHFNLCIHWYTNPSAYVGTGRKLAFFTCHKPTLGMLCSVAAASAAVCGCGHTGLHHVRSAHMADRCACVWSSMFAVGGAPAATHSAWRRTSGA